MPGVTTVTRNESKPAAPTRNRRAFGLAAGAEEGFHGRSFRRRRPAMKQFGKAADELNGVMKKLMIVVVVWSGLVCCGDIRGEGASGQMVSRKANSLQGLLRDSNPPDTNELRRLLEAGADLNAKDPWGTTTALFMAVQRAGDTGKGGPLNE